MKKIITISILLTIAFISFSQTEESSDKYFGSPIFIDSTDYMLVPIRYNPGESLNNSKSYFQRTHYANILVVNLSTKEKRKVFNEDTFIEYIRKDNSYYYANKTSYSRIEIDDNFTKTKIIYIVRNVDFNKNRRIDSNDPKILYISDFDGTNLKRLTPENENVVGHYTSSDNNILVIKIQRDLNEDNEFSSGDDFYFITIDSRSLEKIDTIEIKN